MATSTFPTLVTGVTVQTATAGALSGDGSSGNKLAVGVDGVTVTVNGSDQLVASGGGGTPAGAIGSIQFNNSGMFGGIAPSTTPGDLLQVVAINTQPTFAQILAVHPEVLLDPWTATTNVNYASADIVTFVHGGSFVWFSEVSGDPTNTGGSEPDWASAPNPGDTLADGDVTWTNIGLWSAWPPTPTAWQADTEYVMPVFVWPTVPNGHLYVNYVYDSTSGSSEPTFPTDFATYVSDGNGYWMDLGISALPQTEPTWAAVSLPTAPSFDTLVVSQAAAIGPDAVLGFNPMTGVNATLAIAKTFTDGTQSPAGLILSTNASFSSDGVAGGSGFSNFIEVGAFFNTAGWYGIDTSLSFTGGSGNAIGGLIGTESDVFDGSGGASESLEGVHASATKSAMGGSATDILGFSAQVNLLAGTANRVIGLLVRGDSGIPMGGTATTLAGVMIDGLGGGGTITTAYGYYAADLSMVGAASAYPFYYNGPTNGKFWVDSAGAVVTESTVTASDFVKSSFACPMGQHSVVTWSTDDTGTLIPAKTACM